LPDNTRSDRRGTPSATIEPEVSALATPSLDAWRTGELPELCPMVIGGRSVASAAARTALVDPTTEETWIASSEACAE